MGMGTGECFGYHESVSVSEKRTGEIDRGAAFEKLIHFMNENKNISLYLPESFEWLVLASGAVEDSEIKKFLLIRASILKAANILVGSVFLLNYW